MKKLLDTPPGKRFCERGSEDQVCYLNEFLQDLGRSEDLSTYTLKDLAKEIRLVAMPDGKRKTVGLLLEHLTADELKKFALVVREIDRADLVPDIVSFYEAVYAALGEKDGD